jgi:hypothetical protein
MTFRPITITSSCFPALQVMFLPRRVSSLARLQLLSQLLVMLGSTAYLPSGVPPYSPCLANRIGSSTCTCKIFFLASNIKAPCIRPFCARRVCQHTTTSCIALNHRWQRPRWLALSQQVHAAWGYGQASVVRVVRFRPSSLYLPLL